MSKVRIRVLVAEDDEVNARAARTILEKLGCSVDVASNGMEAVEHFRDRVYDLIMMDWQMPIMNGIEATALIRATPRGKITPIIGTTADKSRTECLQVGMNDVVPKPFLFKSMRHTLLRWTAWTGMPSPDPCQA